MIHYAYALKLMLSGVFQWNHTSCLVIQGLCSECDSAIMFWRLDPTETPTLWLPLGQQAMVVAKLYLLFMFNGLYSVFNLILLMKKANFMSKDGVII